MNSATTTTQTEMIDAQARVIRSLNLVHSADTQYMIGAVQLENLFKLKTENDELRQRMKDDGEYICTLSERCERYRDALLKHKAENQHLTDKIHQLYEGAEEQKQRINNLEAELERTKKERNAIAKNTREPLLLKLDEANDRIKRMEDAGDAMMSEPCEYTFEQWIKAKEAKP